MREPASKTNRYQKIDDFCRLAGLFLSGEAPDREGDEEGEHRSFLVSSAALLGKPPSAQFGQALPVLARRLKIIDFSLPWSFATDSILIF